MARALLVVLALSGAIWTAAPRAQTPPEDFRPLAVEVEAFIDYMARQHGFEPRALRQLFAQLKPNNGVQRAIAAPSTARPWHEFRPLFVDRARVDNGVKFWDTYAEPLARASEQFEVPQAVIVSIIGIETRYGRMTGNFSVLDALHTLAFKSQGRPEFFRQELEQFLLLAREQNWDPLKVKGSYAGAMGLPQFMPSSYRRYAIDFDGDGAIDLWTNPSDVIGSVASYLRQFGWKNGEPVVAPALVDGDPEALLALGLAPSFTVEQWRMRGVDTKAEVGQTLPAALFRLDLANGGQQFMLGFDNFRTILQYNRSRHYAMAVYELANEIERARQQSKTVVVGLP
ncbi:MAG TPA: lytic murein transglycosylase B [Burkholderiales bacterium]|nr:lytic murein transglycosylase B [Burkholderiales bacterium]